MSTTKIDRDELDGRAAEYALGALDGGERAAFEQEFASNLKARQAVARWEAMLGLFSDAPAVEPAAAVWRNIEGELDATATDRAGTSTIRFGEGEWVVIVPGVEKQSLFIDREAGTESYYLRVAAGATVPPHDHARVEECVMISGEMWIGDEKLVAGDYHIAHAGSRHEDVRSLIGATFYVRATLKEVA